MKIIGTDNLVSSRETRRAGTLWLDGVLDTEMKSGTACRR